MRRVLGRWDKGMWHSRHANDRREHDWDHDRRYDDHDRYGWYGHGHHQHGDHRWGWVGRDHDGYGHDYGYGCHGYEHGHGYEHDPVVIVHY